MSTINPTLPSDGQTVDAADVNTPFNAILGEFNGNIDNDNIKAGANIAGSKLGDETLSATKFDSTTKGGWVTTTNTPNTITYNGNRSYDLVFNSVDLTSTLSEGMRLRLTRTESAQTQCTDLESSSSQYWNDTSVSGMTFTDDFVVGAWVKLESYPSQGTIISRYNGTSGWQLYINSSGQVVLGGNNASASNFSAVSSMQSIPLGRWVHIAAQLDMSAFTATTTTSYVMIDGVDVPATVSRGGTNPTALVQAGNLEVGSSNASGFFDGKLAQVFVSSAKITQANVRTLISQGLTASLISTHSIASAYSFDGNANDLNTTSANNLTAQGSAVATNVDSPYGNYLGGTLEYAIISAKPTFSTNTTVTVQVPEGCAIPTSGGISAVSYSTNKVPYGFTANEGRWRLSSFWRTDTNTTSNATYGSFSSGGWALTVPIGGWRFGWQANFATTSTTQVVFNVSRTALTGLSASAGNDASPYGMAVTSSAAAYAQFPGYVSGEEVLSVASTFVMYTVGSVANTQITGTRGRCEIFALPAYL